MVDGREGDHRLVILLVCFDFQTHSLAETQWISLIFGDLERERESTNAVQSALYFVFLSSNIFPLYYWEE